MRLLVGLGNPGEKYRDNRHNIGFMLVDYLKSQNSKLKTFHIIKSSEFMNGSGNFVRRLISQYPSISVSDLYIIHDDLDIPLGEFKIQFGKGPKVHNGINSIEEKLGTKDFWRVRVGIENRDNESGIISNGKKTPGEKYVLQDFTDQETKVLNNVFSKILFQLKNA